MTHWLQQYVTCTGCGKRGYYTRALAKKAARSGSLTGLSAYRCPDSDTEVWHLGHLPDSVRAGRKARDDLGYSAPRPVFHRSKGGKHKGEKHVPKHKG